MRAEGGPYRAGDVAAACGGVLAAGDPDTTFDAISTDSRDIRSGDLFIPLKGENFDGHDFLLPALEAGARGSLVDRELNRVIPPDLTKHVLIQVKDTLQSLADLASAHRLIYPTPLIAVTGSSGKTTVKEMIAAVLRRSHHPLVSLANFNNLIGLPMTVLNLGPSHTAAVVEAGINVPGEMEFLAKAARPDVAVITTIGPVHLEGLGTVENVAREKFKLVEGVKPGGIGVVPKISPPLEPLLAKYSGNLVTFGGRDGDFRATEQHTGDGIRFVLESPYGTRKVSLQVPGAHNVNNALAAAAAVTALGVGLDDVVAGLERFTPPAMRMETVELSGGRILLKDCYNANPLSVHAALEVLASRNDRGATLAVLADMRELGDHAEPLHAEVGETAGLLGISRVLFVGEFGSAFERGYLAAGAPRERLTVVPDKERAWEAICSGIGDFATILVKGSRAMKMEILAERIVEAR